MLMVIHILYGTEETDQDYLSLIKKYQSEHQKYLLLLSLLPVYLHQEIWIAYHQGGSITY